MICKRCGVTINDTHECLYLTELITSEQTKVSDINPIQMNSMLQWMLTPKDKEWTREETIVVSFGIAIAVTLVSITIMSAIF